MNRRKSVLLTAIVMGVAVAALYADDLGLRRPRGRLSVITEPTQAARLVSPRPADDDELGRSVAVGPGVAVVGAPGNVTAPGHEAPGAAHIFVLDGARWRHRQRLVAFDSEPTDSFGRSVAVSGDTIVVGAEHDIIDGVTAAGSVYVFVRDGRRWSFERKLVAPDPRPEAHFGHSVALDGDTLAVGTWATDSVFVYERTGAWWPEPQVIRPEIGQGGNFGHSLALDDDTLVVGAEWRWDPDHLTAGGASVYARIDTEWMFDQALDASDGYTNDQFGASVAVAGDVIVVGAPENDGDGVENRGAAYVFRHRDDGWSEEQKLVPCVELPWQHFGWSVATAAGKILVGAPWDTVRDLSRAGCVHLFRRSGQSWIASCVLVAGDAAPWDELGEVAVSGHAAVVGARLADIGQNLNAGAAYVFLIP